MTDDAAIRDVIARYALTLDADDIDGCLELFVDDADYVVFGKTLTGPERIGRMFHRAPRGMHLTGVSVIDIDGDRARARTQVLFVESGTHVLRPALYDDELVKNGSGWRFTKRAARFITADGLADAPETAG